MGVTSVGMKTNLSGDDSLDYIDDLNEVYGMKLVTPEEYQELPALRTRWYASRVLAMHWSVLLEAPTMDDKSGRCPSSPRTTRR